MNKRIVGIGVGVWLAVVPAWVGAQPPADQNAKKLERFQAQKSKMIEMMEQKLTCLKAANTPADMKSCHEAQKARQQAEQLQRIQEQRKKLDKRENALKEKQGEATQPAVTTPPAATH